MPWSLVAASASAAIISAVRLLSLAGRLTINPGSNNPVGTTWIALSRPGYGIHGSPDPDLVGKTASHGCIRLTNWDAAALGKAAKKGTRVEFVGEEQPKPARRS